MKKIHTRAKRRRCMHTHLCGAKKFKEAKLRLFRRTVVNLKKE